MKNFGKGYWKTFEEGIQREWVITNGIGGYAGDSVIGAHTRKHHGLLIASLRPPVERYLVISKVEDTLQVGARQYNLAANQRKKRTVEGHSVKEGHSTIKRHSIEKRHFMEKRYSIEEGQQYLQRFQFDEVPAYVYHVEDIHLTKTIAMEYGHNTTVIGYEIKNGSQSAKLTLIPCFNYREHGAGSSIVDLAFLKESHLMGNGIELCLTPERNRELRIRLYSSEGLVQDNSGACYDTDLELQTEIDTGMSCWDNNYKPYRIEIALEPYETKRISVTVSVENNYPKDAFRVIRDYRERKQQLVEQALQLWRKRWTLSEPAEAAAVEFFSDLVKAADCFIADRQSTGYKTILAGLPWFTDWGRDTMIAMQGLTLVTGRFRDARNILLTFAQYVKNGLVPNMFPDEGLEPLYNTVDASLWYFHSVDQYLKYTKENVEYDFVEQEIYPKLQEIMEAYQGGTSFSIYMDDDGLIHAGGGLDQVTWMDVRVGDRVMTPRHGKPVEINALWYNALKVMEELTLRYRGKEAAELFGNLAEKTKKSFCLKFWNTEKNCLYDVAEEETAEGIRSNDQIRPNQIYAVSLPHTMLERDMEMAVVNTVFSHLYATYGLRSLSPEDKDYKEQYFGPLQERDEAYHQGTVWAFPLGAFITAYVKVHDYSEESVLYAKELLEAMEDHLRDGCIGQIAEIFDGKEPHISRGCYGQAWSVGEILRAYAEDALGKLPQSVN